MSVHGCGVNIREVMSNFSKFTDLKQFDNITFARINSGVPLTVSDDYERVCFTDGANVTLTLCKWDTSSREVSSKLHKFMTFKKTDHIHFARLNCREPRTVTDDTDLVGWITTSNVMLPLFNWDTSLRDMISNLSKFTDLKS